MEDSLEKFERLASLEHDFVYAAESYGRIIISEHLLPNDQKTIRPVSVGGIAGGEKYIVQGILFKFAVESDTYGLYGNDENAMKTAAHELNGCTSFLNCGVKGLHVPLMAYIDYRGFRLMAMSLLPINKTTLVYGSSDAGVTVHTSNTMFNHLFTSAARILNLRPHVVCDAAGTRKTLCGPIDIEGHSGTDNRFYLLDFARLSPPEPPVHRGAYLYRLLRLEFVRTYMMPLCSDAFSPMASIDVELHNQEVREAFDHLLTVVIPTFVAKCQGEQDMYETEFAKLCHGDGINIRHIGVVHQNSTSDHLRRFLKVEAISRTLKSLTRELLRREMKKTHLPSDYPYRRIILNFINLVFGSTDASTTFWETILQPKLVKKFKGILDQDTNGLLEERPLGLLEDNEDRYRIFCNYIKSIGLVISKEAKVEFKRNPFITFVDPDIIDMKTQITRLNIIDYADEKEEFDETIKAINSTLLEDHNYAKAHLLIADLYSLYPQLHQVDQDQVAVHYETAITIDPSLVVKLEPAIGRDVWKFFTLSRSSPVIADMVRSTIKQQSKLVIPSTVNILESDISMFEDISPAKIILKAASEETIHSIMMFSKYKASHLNLVGATLGETSLSYLTNLVSINVARCPMITDAILEPLITPLLKKLKIYELDGVSDALLYYISEKATNLEVLDMAMPTNVTYLPIKSLVSTLTKLTALDLYKTSTNDIPLGFYNEAFQICSSLVKMRDST
eukprot:gene13644-16064_t